MGLGGGGAAAGGMEPGVDWTQSFGGSLGGLEGRYPEASGHGGQSYFAVGKDELESTRKTTPVVGEFTTW